MAKGTNPQSAEFWQGYRDGAAEIIELGIVGFQAKYHAEFEGNDTNHFKGMAKAFAEYKRRLAGMRSK